MQTRTIPLARTRPGRPALVECGGGATNTGSATIIAGPAGEALRPYHIYRRGSLAGGDHALLPALVGGQQGECDHHRGDFSGTVSRIVSLDGESATVGAVASYGEGQWLIDGQPVESADIDAMAFGAAVNAAAEKARCYHCRCVHFAAAPEAVGMGAAR